MRFGKKIQNARDLLFVDFITMFKNVTGFLPSHKLKTQDYQSYLNSKNFNKKERKNKVKLNKDKLLNFNINFNLLTLNLTIVT